MDIGPVFQSAPLTDVRGDNHPQVLIEVIFRFQSAPLTDVRGDFCIAACAMSQM